MTIAEQLRLETREEIALKLFKEGSKRDFIARVTDLPMARLEELQLLAEADNK